MGMQIFLPSGDLNLSLCFVDELEEVFFFPLSVYSFSSSMIQQTHQDKKIFRPNKGINEKRFFHFFSPFFPGQNRKTFGKGLKCKNCLIKWEDSLVKLCGGGFFLFRS